ncbi:efflux RND transporter periplasmic adaptor subunit [Shouchella shacheensis]|uniref:efflux RND transporter periplasmic adaptor subunit n=1 Tax=Shouchella shacheensis TaxID=1649580 RepID=UPI00073FE382|nr:efflux RND transporter periplasmic adaptor subunit [Shouchella shacheensis]
MNGKKVLVVLMLGSALATFTTFGIQQTSEMSVQAEVVSVEVANPQLGPVSETVSFSGSLNLSDRQMVYEVEESGSYEWLVDVGQAVGEGEPLLSYDTDELDMELASIEAQLAGLNEALELVDRQEAQVEVEQQTQQASGLRSNAGQAADDHSGEREGTESEVLSEVIQASERNAELRELSRERRELSHEIVRLTAEQEVLVQKREKLTVTSEMDGIVLSVAKDKGERSDGPLVEVADPETFTLTGDVSELDSYRIEEGQQVRLTSAAAVDQRWAGEIIEIGDVPSGYVDEASTQPQYAVSVALLEGDTERLKAGYRMQGEIILKEVEGLSVPAELVEESDDSSYVFVHENGRAWAREVELGFQADGKVEVTDGLSEEDQIIIEHGSVPLEEGMKVSY